MKTQLTLLVLLFLCFNQISCHFDLKKYFGNNAQSVLSFNDFNNLCHSKSKKIGLNKLLHKSGDIDFDGHLSLPEFIPIYTRFIQAIGGQTPSQELIEETFGCADHIQKDGKLSYKELKWCIGRELGFLGKNVNLLTINHDKDEDFSIPDLIGLFNNSIFTELFDMFCKQFENIKITMEKCKQILEFIGGFCKLDLDWSDCVLSGYLKLADVDGDNLISLGEFKEFLKFLFKNLGNIINYV